MEQGFQALEQKVREAIRSLALLRQREQARIEELAGARAALAVVEEAVRRLEAERAQLQEARSAAEAARQVLATELREVQAEVAHADTAGGEGGAAAELASLREGHQALLAERGAWEDERFAWDAECTRLREENARLLEQIEDTAGAQAGTDDERTSIEAELSAAREKLASVQDELAVTRKSLAGARAELARERDGRIAAEQGLEAERARAEELADEASRGDEGAATRAQALAAELETLSRERSEVRERVARIAAVLDRLA